MLNVVGGIAKPPLKSYGLVIKLHTDPSPNHQSYRFRSSLLVTQIPGHIRGQIYGRQTTKTKWKKQL